MPITARDTCISFRISIEWDRGQHPKITQRKSVICRAPFLREATLSHILIEAPLSHTLLCQRSFMFRSRIGSSPVLQRATMPSEVDLAKRELVKVLKSLAAKYKIDLELSRDSSEKDVKKAFRKVSVNS